MELTKKNDRLDRRCALEGHAHIACVPLAEDSDDWCHGCKFYICDAHSKNIALWPGHDVMAHVECYDDEDTLD